MKNNNLQKVVIWMFILLLTFQLVTAIGIRPAKTTLISEEGLVYSDSFWIVNNEGRGFKVDLSVEGELAEYVTLKKNTLIFRDDDDAKEVEFEVNLPENVPPGTSTANIVIEEKLNENEPEIISSKLILKHKIIVEGPYPDKYIKVKLNFHDQGDKILFVSEVENLGKLSIDSVKTTFYVNDKEKTEQTLTTAETSLGKKENKLLEAEIERDVFELGEFEVSAVTKYDDQTLEIVKKLMVGSPKIEITYFDKYFVANKINQYVMELFNKWNQQVENVYVDVEVNKDGQKIDEFRTKSVDIEGEVMKRISDYFDARGKNEGKYVFKMIVNFWNSYKMESQEYEIELLNENDFEDISGNTNAIVGKATGEGSFSSTILWVIIVTLILVIGGIVSYKYMKKDELE